MAYSANTNMVVIVILFSQLIGRSKMTESGYNVARRLGRAIRQVVTVVKSEDRRLRWALSPYPPSPETWAIISRTLAFSEAHSSCRAHSPGPGSKSFTFVFQLNEAKPGGRAVTLRPCAKSSIKIPIAAAAKALEHDAM